MREDTLPDAARADPVRIAHFRIEGRVGQGGMGVVYRAEDETLRRTSKPSSPPGSCGGGDSGAGCVGAWRAGDRGVAGLWRSAASVGGGSVGGACGGAAGSGVAPPVAVRLLRNHPLDI